jgi:pyruvate/2-oxoglutarate dehydrogenase complex dihydrolipoamide dehydrogenase (E3) component
MAAHTRLDRTHALVLGGSMAGLLAARVLAEHYRNVTVVDRDLLPGHTAPRRCVPQDRHAKDSSVATAFIRVASFIDPPAKLFLPGLVLRVLARQTPHKPAAEGANVRLRAARGERAFRGEASARARDCATELSARARGV